MTREISMCYSLHKHTNDKFIENKTSSPQLKLQEHHLLYYQKPPDGPDVLFWEPSVFKDKIQRVSHMIPWVHCLQSSFAFYILLSPTCRGGSLALDSVFDFSTPFSPHCVSPLTVRLHMQVYNCICMCECACF